MDQGIDVENVILSYGSGGGSGSEKSASVKLYRKCQIHIPATITAAESSVTLGDFLKVLARGEQT